MTKDSPCTAMQSQQALSAQAMMGSLWARGQIHHDSYELSKSAATAMEVLRWGPPAQVRAHLWPRLRAGIAPNGYVDVLGGVEGVGKNHLHLSSGRLSLESR